jgi:citrate lyase beta subunit
MMKNNAFSRPKNRDKKAIRFNGKMVERLHLAQTQRALAIREAIMIGG